MIKKVFLQSVIRRPVRNLVLVLLVGTAVFAAVLRAAEYIIVRDEIARIESFYRSIGFLSTVDPARRNFLDFEDTRWQEVIEQSQYVDFIDSRSLVTGELVDMYNTENMRILWGSPFFSGETWYERDWTKWSNWSTFESEYAPVDAYFFGTLTDVTFYTDPEPITRNLFFNRISIRVGGTYAILHFDVDEILAGYEGEHLMVGLPVRLVAPVDEHGYHPILDMEIGERYLLRGSYSYEVLVMGTPYGSSISLGHSIFPEQMNHPVHNFLRLAPFTLAFRPLLPESGMLFLLADDPELNGVLARLENRMENLDRNMRSVVLQTTADMYSMHVYKAHVGLVGYQFGRWIDMDDYLNANPVVVVSERFMRVRGLKFGDTIRVTLRENIPDVLPYAYDDWRGYRTHTLELEIIGTFGLMPHGMNFAGANWANNHPGDPIYFIYGANYAPYFISHFMYIPTSVVPEGFAVYHDDLYWDNQFSFILDSTRNERLFIEENRDALAALGYNVHFVPQPGAINFFFAVDNILLALGFNTIIFSVTSALMLALAVFIYIMMMRRNFAIMRGLGDSKGVAVRQILLPVVVIWIPVVVTASFAAWFYAAGIAGEALAIVHDIEPHLAHMVRDGEPGIAWPVGLAALMAAVTVAAVFAGVVAIARRPVLELLQKAGR